MSISISTSTTPGGGPTRTPGPARRPGGKASRRIAPTLLLAVVAALVSTVPAEAAVPNDDLETATLISSIPFSETINTGDATTSSHEANCGMHDVWYKYPTPPVDTALTFQLGNVDGGVRLTRPMVGVVINERSGDLSQWECGMVETDQIRTEVIPAGKDAYIFIANAATSGNPGLIQLDVIAADPINHFGIAISPSGTVDKTGAMTVSGTVSCDRDGQVLRNVYAKQKSGHGYIAGETGLHSFECVAPTSPWSTTFTPTAGGRFVGGSATVSSELACSDLACEGTFAEATVQLKPRR
jgi:hypothetical protein